MKKISPTFYCGFGDNRLFGDKDKQKLIDIREFQISYYSGRFNLDLNGDYSLHKVSDDFRFCKTYFSVDYTKIRAELRQTKAYLRTMILTMIHSRQINKSILYNIRK